MAYNEEFMREAVRLASENIDNGGGPFGAVIVKDGKIIGRGTNGVTLHADPTAHAEVTAIRNTCREMDTFMLDGCEIYSSCEPCPMCLSAIYWAHINKIYFGATKHDAANVGFDDSFIYEELARPMAERRVGAEEHDRVHATEVFDKWSRKDDKIEY